MATISQIRGALLEEVMLAFLRDSGFDAVEHPDSDPTLRMGPAGLEVRGRGSRHQADAVADFRVVMPFSHPTRLIVEAKFRANNRVGLEVVRNAVGVRTDIGEYFTPTRTGIPTHPRYHYQYAIFSATDFSVPAQRYAYAHDIYLFPLAKSRHMRPVVDEIRLIGGRDFGATDEDHIGIKLGTFRKEMRQAFRLDPGGELDLGLFEEHPDIAAKAATLAERVRSVGATLIGRANKHFLLHLAPANRQSLMQIIRREPPVYVRIHYDDSSWYLTDADSGENLFSFDLPDELFKLYDDSGILTRAAAVAMKQEQLAEIEALYSEGQSIRRVAFHLDQGWINRVRDGIETLARPRR